MKQALRYFSLGLLLSALISFSVYHFSNPSSKTATQSTDEMIASIENDGYHVLSEDEYIDFRVKGNDTAKKDDKDKKEAKDKDKKDNEDKSKSDDKKDDGDKKEKNDKKDKKDDNKKSKSKSSDKDKKSKDKEIKITVKEGMVSQDIASLLKDEDIIDDRQKFIDYMEKNNISSSMQIGTFKLKQDMSFDEIGEVLQTYPGN